MNREEFTDLVMQMKKTLEDNGIPVVVTKHPIVQARHYILSNAALEHADRCLMIGRPLNDLPSENERIIVTRYKTRAGSTTSQEKDVSKYELLSPENITQCIDHFTK